jgi:hypothetical protein
MQAFSVAQTFLAAVSQGFPACVGPALATTKLTLVKPADRNVGDTADRNVCATKARALYTYNLVGPFGEVARPYPPGGFGLSI